MNGKHFVAINLALVLCPLLVAIGGVRRYFKIKLLVVEKALARKRRSDWLSQHPLVIFVIKIKFFVSHLKHVITARYKGHTFSLYNHSETSLSKRVGKINYIGRWF